MAESEGEFAALLAAAESSSPVDSVDVLAGELRQRFGVSAASLLVTDVLGQTLVRVGEGGRSTEPITLRGSVYEQVFRTQRPHQEPAPAPGGHRLIFPVTNRGDPLGLLEVTVPGDPGDRLRTQLATAAHALAYVVVTDGRFTDLYHRNRRTTDVSLAAEIQYHLLPSALCCEAAQFAVAGALEPAATIGGDTFDYSLDRHTVQLSVTDAMGHNVAAALLATLLVSALREGRRAGAGLAEQARRAHQAVLDHGMGAMATGQLIRVDLRAGRAELVNAGHPRPLRLRGGTVEEIALAADLPFGVASSGAYRVQDVELRPGDRLIMLTDGMQERSATEVDLPALIAGTRELHPREAVRALAGAVADAAEGRLTDDATVMCLDWYGPQGVRRDAETGANLRRTSRRQ
ncbi:PP2C family protein-serine/threonine phosphatase [Streptomyces sp. YIM 98790]|uniref:PP2C family protein-serine/threonine phosphatase n=1 Tax=Streptomyces sp. YIM 98790 TaxID=2689077 RepID=UPI0028BD32CC|nr:PP2C family protein-serine/threonine phosphatase [Streptomyces sp. YIM 98790]